MNKPEKEEKKTNVYLRLTSVAVQMGGVIGGFSWLGNYLDKKQHNITPGWTIVLALLGVAISMYLVIKEVQNINNSSSK